MSSFTDDDPFKNWPPPEPDVFGPTEKHLTGVEIICHLLTEILAEVKRGNSIQREGAVSSVQIEDNPTRDLKVRVTTKTYTVSETPVAEALEAHGRAHREAERQAMQQWEDTLKANGVTQP